MRTPGEIESDQAQAAYWILRAQSEAMAAGCPRAAVGALTAEILRAIRDAVIRETMLQPAAYDVRAIAALVGVELPAIDGDDDDDDDPGQLRLLDEEMELGVYSREEEGHENQ